MLSLRDVIDFVQLSDLEEKTCGETQTVADMVETLHHSGQYAAEKPVEPVVVPGLVRTEQAETVEAAQEAHLALFSGEVLDRADLYYGREPLDL